MPVASISWAPCFRIIPSRFPPIGLYDRVADPGDLEAVFQIEAMTNDRLRQEAGEISLVPKEDRVSGPGTTPIMAAFTHPNPAGDRFTDGQFGAFYAARTLETAIAETSYHRAVFLGATGEPAQEIDMRVYAVDLAAKLHDIRALRSVRPDLYDPENYTASQGFSRLLRDAGADGIVYQSVRDGRGECAVIFRPQLLSNCRQERHLCYIWDGHSIATVYEKKPLSPEV